MRFEPIAFGFASNLVFTYFSLKKHKIRFGGRLDNQAWADRIIKRFDASFRHRWELFDQQIKIHLNKNTTWLDLGCGDNASVAEFASLARYAVGADLIRVERVHLPFVQADIRHLPFADQSVDLITLRFVVEHFQSGQDYFNELHRVLKPKGRVIFVTTNIWSPFIFLPRLLLPYKLKHFMITRIFKVHDEDIFPTYHKVNSKRAVNKISGFRTVRFEYVSDLNYTRKWMFLIFLSWHLLTKWLRLKSLRTNILAVLEKNV